MGLTFLAWANSVGDLVADISLAKIGETSVEKIKKKLKHKFRKSSNCCGGLFRYSTFEPSGGDWFGLYNWNFDRRNSRRWRALICEF